MPHSNEYKKQRSVGRLALELLGPKDGDFEYGPAGDGKPKIRVFADWGLDETYYCDTIRSCFVIARRKMRQKHSENWCRYMWECRWYRGRIL